MSTNSKAKQLVGYAFLVILAKEKHGITEAELQMLERLALEDGEVDEAEKDVLRKIFARLDHDEVVHTVLEEIEDFREKYDV